MTNRFILCLFAWSIVLCAASRWRIAGVGAGEAVLGFATVLALLQNRRVNPLTHSLKTWYWFMGVSISGLLIGTLWAGALGVWELANFSHDALALLFCFGCLSLLLPRLTEATDRTYFTRQLLGASLVLVLINLFFYAFFQVLQGERTTWISRFNGLSANPNQLALYVCTLPFWLLQRPWLFNRWVVWLAVGASLLVGLLTGSEALLLGWMVGFAWLLMQTALRGSWRKDPVQNEHAKAVLTFGLVFGVGSVIALSWAYAADVYAIGGQGDLRLQRWRNGLSAVAGSALFGLGPGSFSGNTAPFEGHEAHNLYIDWTASGGLLAGVMLLWFQSRVWASVVTGKTAVLAAGFVSLLVFNCFHYMARHPVFWLNHLLILSQLQGQTRKPCVESLAL